MKTQSEILVDWLRDAHAMETKLVTVLETQARRLTDYPLMSKRLAEHAEESRSHAQKVDECLTALGSGTSTGKDLVAKAGGALEPLAIAAFPDEPVKGALTNIAAEHFEIACYRALKAAAERCQEDAVARTVTGILEEEQAMAQWLEHHLASTTVTYLSHRIGTAVG